MSVTIQDIADMAGVHKSTVYKVIHDREGVSAKKREEIKRLLKENHYEVNPLAKAMNYQKRAINVAVVIPDVDAFPELRDGIELVTPDFQNFNIRILYYNDRISNASDEADVIRSLEKDKIAGAVILPLESDEVASALRGLKEKGIPFVTVNSDLRTSGRIAFVGQNMVQSGQTAVRMFHLVLRRGKIGLITRRNLKALREREDSFIAYARKYYPEITTDCILELPDAHDEIARSVTELLQNHPDLNGLFITCGDVPEVLRAVRDAGKAGSLAVICYERYPKIEELIRSGEILCTISGNVRNQGRIAMRLLFEYLVYHQLPEQDVIYTKNEILIKENL